MEPTTPSLNHSRARAVATGAAVGDLQWKIRKTHPKDRFSQFTTLCCNVSLENGTHKKLLDFKFLPDYQIDNYYYMIKCNSFTSRTNYTTHVRRNTSNNKHETTLCSSPSSPQIFTTKSELYKAPFLSFSTLKRHCSCPCRNRNSNDSTYSDDNLLTICTSSFSEDQSLSLILDVHRISSLAASRFKLFLESGKDAVSDLQTLVSLDVQEINDAVRWSSVASSGQASRSNPQARAQNNLPKGWPASLPRQSLEVDKEDYHREANIIVRGKKL
ncbi:hypothetical protein Bca52824_016874 [Brassica carinata]|uniref:Uncharacterized protein n=1 Tax=Brassica carinata TaxID=52824 RepID=A0A8X7W4X3_BRACI|nr:hypothetical protein Bca52824_016874 [Brassica carinata]